MKNFRAYVVRYSNEKLENFVPMDSLPADLFKQETWKRNNIKEVHVISNVAFVATNADKLRLLMLPLQNFVDRTPAKILKRVEHDKQAIALKHGDPALNIPSFENQVLDHAK